jgi:DNA modification methylase
MKFRIEQGDNLETLHRLKAEGAKFDLVELDGPYMAGLEGWDILTEKEYIAHYAERLAVIREMLQPWGVVFVFGYPEGCSEIKAWAHQTETLYLRRWISWYKQVTAHKGRKIENILIFVEASYNEHIQNFRTEMKKRREMMGLKIVDACRKTGINAHLAHKVGGYLWFENENASIPTKSDYGKLKDLLHLPDDFDNVPNFGNFKGLSDIDYLSKTYIEDTKKLNDNGLRSKPVQLYIDLFKPTIPPTENREALVLYGGSGNAGIAAAALGYGVTLCEASPSRCEAIADRWENEVKGWALKLSQMDMFDCPSPEQTALFAWGINH